MTAQQLFAALTDAGVVLSVDGTVLACEGEPSVDLLPRMVVLQTGLRALLTRRPWWGCSSETGRVELLATNQLIPPGVSLLCVEGDGSAGSPWDRITPDARLDYPELFEGVATVRGDAEQGEAEPTGATAA